MTIHCFRRAIRVAGIAFALMPVAGCSSHGAAERMEMNQALPARTSGVSGGPGAASSARSGGVSKENDDAAQHLMHPTAVEQHHFNAYKRFRAMMDVSSGSSADGEARSGTGAQHGELVGDSACSGDSLVKQGD